MMNNSSNSPKMEAIHLKRISKMWASLCTEKLPYQSKLFEKLQSNSFDLSLENVELLLVFFSELCDVCFFLFKKRGESPFCLDAEKSELVWRYRQYQDFKKDGKADYEIYKKMYDCDPCIKKGTLKQYINKMRKWKHDHKDILEAPTSYDIFDADSCLRWPPSPDIENIDFWEYYEHLIQIRSWGKYAMPLLPKFLKEDDGDTPKTGRSIFLWIEHLFISIFAKIRVIMEEYEACKDGLLSYACYLMISDNRKFRDLKIRAEEQRKKAPIRPRKEDHKADISRALAADRVGEDADEEVFKAAEKTARKKLSSLSAELHGIIPKTFSEKIASAEMRKFFCDTIQRRNAPKDKRPRGKKIHSWSDVIALLRQFDKGDNLEEDLAKIFYVCAKKRSWKLPKELNLKQQYEYWLIVGFFAALRSQLAKYYNIKEMKNLRWHRIDLPSDLKNKLHMYHLEPSQKDQKPRLDQDKYWSPFWGKCSSHS